MPKYKDSPEARAAKKERTEKLIEFLQLPDVEDYSDLRSVFYRLFCVILSMAIEFLPLEDYGGNYILTHSIAFSILF